jgi:hypothetical protein
VDERVPLAWGRRTTRRGKRERTQPRDRRRSPRVPIPPELAREARGTAQRRLDETHAAALPFIRLFLGDDLILLSYFRVFLPNFRGTFVRKFAEIRFADGALSFTKAPMFEP